MRRVISVILMAIGGWILSSGLMIASITVSAEEGAGLRLVMMGFVVIIAALPMLLGMLISPGNRPAELGMTLMIVAAVAAGVVLMMAMILHDPGFARIMPPGRAVPRLAFAPLWGTAAFALVGAGGYALRRWAVARARNAEPDLERIFGSR